jgi:hypothetical protein
MSELERANSKGLTKKSSVAPSLANHLLQVAARAEVMAKDVKDEEDYTYPSGKVKWEDTIEGWEESERNKIKESSDHYSLGKDMREWEEKYKPWVFGGKNPDVSVTGNHAKKSKTHGKTGKPVEFLENDQDKEKLVLSRTPTSLRRSPRPSDHIEYRIKKWEKQKEKQKPENDEVESIAQALLDERLLDRIKKSEERGRESDERLENQIDSTLSLENKRNYLGNSG